VPFQLAPTWWPLWEEEADGASPILLLPLGNEWRFIGLFFVEHSVQANPNAALP